jgi:hypothetical protein
MLKKLVLPALAILVIPLASAQAGVRIGVGVGVPYRPYCRPYYRPYYRPFVGVYVGPPSVYVAPPPVYVQPASAPRVRATRSCSTDSAAPGLFGPCAIDCLTLRDTARQQWPGSPACEAN